MASRRAERRRACKGKVRHIDRVGAEAALRVMRRVGTAQGVLRPYMCKFCRGWHVGHLPMSEARRVEEEGGGI